ncbi:MAG: CDGSH iron-sulfur domain-containing protein [Gammaproteobacteria bacterium]|nr:CDGSH iron-sulfur domain-containing protein [Gammaproteobacteria bacterium]
MTKPKIAKRGSYAVELEPGTYHWCACGKSKKQPFCDGSHAGSDFSPIEFKVDQKRTVYLCGCKHSGKAPFCDGSHSSI